MYRMNNKYGLTVNEINSMSYLELTTLLNEKHNLGPLNAVTAASRLRVRAGNLKYFETKIKEASK